MLLEAAGQAEDGLAHYRRAVELEPDNEIYDGRLPDRRCSTRRTAPRSPDASAAGLRSRRATLPRAPSQSATAVASRAPLRAGDRRGDCLPTSRRTERIDAASRPDADPADPDLPAERASARSLPCEAAGLFARLRQPVAAIPARGHCGATTARPSSPRGASDGRPASVASGGRTTAGGLCLKSRSSKHFRWTSRALAYFLMGCTLSKLGSTSSIPQARHGAIRRRAPCRRHAGFSTRRAGQPRYGERARRIRRTHHSMQWIAALRSRRPALAHCLRHVGRLAASDPGDRRLAGRAVGLLHGCGRCVWPWPAAAILLRCATPHAIAARSSDTSRPSAGSTPATSATDLADDLPLPTRSALASGSPIGSASVSSSTSADCTNWSTCRPRPNIRCRRATDESDRIQADPLGPGRPDAGHRRLRRTGAGQPRPPRPCSTSTPATPKTGPWPNWSTARSWSSC